MGSNVWKTNHNSHTLWMRIELGAYGHNLPNEERCPTTAKGKHFQASPPKSALLGVWNAPTATQDTCGHGLTGKSCPSESEPLPPDNPFPAGGSSGAGPVVGTILYHRSTIEEAALGTALREGQKVAMVESPSWKCDLTLECKGREGGKQQLEEKFRMGFMPPQGQKEKGDKIFQKTKKVEHVHCVLWSTTLAVCVSEWVSEWSWASYCGNKILSHLHFGRNGPSLGRWEQLLWIGLWLCWQREGSGGPQLHRLKSKEGQSNHIEIGHKQWNHP